MNDIKANMIIDVYNCLTDMKANDEITHLDFHWDEKNNTFDVNLVPKREIKYVNINVIITPNGIEFK